MLDELLVYHDTPEPGDFTAQVMRGVRRHQRLRRLILWGSGLVGSAFGVAGATLLAEPLGQLLGDLNPLHMGGAVMAVLALLGWLLHEEAGLNS